MVKNVLAIYGKGPVVSVWRSCIHVPTSALIAAQSAATESATTAWAAPWSTTVTATAFDHRSKSEYFGDAQVEAYIAGPPAEIVRDDLLDRAIRARQWVRIETAVGRRDGIYLAATSREGWARVELIVAGQIPARGDVVRGSGVDG